MASRNVSFSKRGQGGGSTAKPYIKPGVNRQHDANINHTWESPEGEQVVQNCVLQPVYDDLLTYKRQATEFKQKLEKAESNATHKDNEIAKLKLKVQRLKVALMDKEAVTDANIADESVSPVSESADVNVFKSNVPMDANKKQDKVPKTAEQRAKKQKKKHVNPKSKWQLKT